MIKLRDCYIPSPILSEGIIWIKTLEIEDEDGHITGVDTQLEDALFLSGLYPTPN